VALVLSWLMGCSWGSRTSFAFIDPSSYLSFVTNARHDHVIYLLTRCSWGVWQLPHPADGRGGAIWFSLRKHGELLGLSVHRAVADRELLRDRRATARLDPVPAQAISQGTPGATWGIILMLVSLAFFIIGFTMGV